MDAGETVLDVEPSDARAALEEALRADRAERGELLRRVAARWPAFLEAWARLSDLAYEQEDDVASYAFSRVGYHRGLDRVRGAGWRGSGPVLWRHPENRGFLRSLYGLMRAAAAIGEGVEARRCREFLLQLDPDDHFSVASIRPGDLSRRLPERPSKEATA